MRSGCSNRPERVRKEANVPNVTDCIVLIGGAHEALQRFERAPAGPFPDKHEDWRRAGYYHPAILNSANSSPGDRPKLWLAARESALAGAVGRWPSMARVPLEETFRAYLTIKKSGPPRRWSTMAALRHPDLRLAVVWWDTVFHHCGHQWAHGGDRTFRVDLTGNDSERFVASGGISGWLIDA